MQKLQYITPEVTVVAVRPSQILAGSVFDKLEFVVPEEKPMKRDIDTYNDEDVLGKPNNGTEMTIRDLWDY